MSIIDRLGDLSVHAITWAVEEVVTNVSFTSDECGGRRQSIQLPKIA